MDPEQRLQDVTTVPSSGPESLSKETRLVSQILEKDRKATAEFVSQYSDFVYRYVRHRLAPRADLVDDLVQEVFLAALANLASFRATSTLKSWLLGIARHKVEDHYRAQLREPAPLDEAGEDEPAADLAILDDAIDHERMAARARQVLRQLPEQYSFALLWRYWENRSVREIAHATGKTEKGIERVLSRARARFKELWDRG